MQRTGHAIAFIRVSLAVIKTITKNKYIWIHATLKITVHHGGKSGQKLKAGAWRQEVNQKPQKKAAYWIALQIHLSSSSQDYLPRGCGTSHSGLGPHPSIITQKQMPPPSCL